MSELLRITTEYVETEDRFRLSGEVRENQTVEMWLTQRLLVRLLPHLFAWLEKEEEKSNAALPADIVQSFAQQAAQASLAPEAPVQREADTQTWLVQAVDISTDQEVLALRFRGFKEEQIRLTLPQQVLRQWLGILHVLWGRAEWPAGLWPEWIASNPSRDNGASRLLLH